MFEGLDASVATDALDDEVSTLAICEFLDRCHRVGLGDIDHIFVPQFPRDIASERLCIDDDHTSGIAFPNDLRAQGTYDPLAEHDNGLPGFYWRSAHPHHRTGREWEKGRSLIAEFVRKGEGTPSSIGFARDDVLSVRGVRHDTLSNCEILDVASHPHDLTRVGIPHHFRTYRLFPDVSPK